MKRVYLDYGATSPIKPEVKNAIMPYLEDKFGNPSSIHEWGRVARQAVDESRRTVADFLGAKENEIIFTSGGTESDNMAIRGIIVGFGARLKNNICPHIITTEIEHHAVLRTCQHLEKNGLAKVTYLKPNSDGLVGVEEVKKAFKENTILVSIMYVNNEIGTVQPIREIGKMIQKENAVKCADYFSQIYFHTDAVQAAAYQNMNVDFLHVDLLTISGHKIGAPKGIGALYIRKGTPVSKILFGGEQELNLRPGTENVIGIVALGEATKVLRNAFRHPKLEIRAEKIRELQDYFIDKILKEISKVELNGSREVRSPHNINFYFTGIEGESILLNLDLVGIAASSGSACTSQSLEPSHVLVSIYHNPERAHGSIRFTLGETTTKEEIDYTIENLKIIVKKLRAMSPLWKS